MLPRLSILVRLLLLLAVPLAALMIVGLSGLASINATGATTAELQTRLQLQSHLEELREATNAAAQPVNAWLNAQMETRGALEALSAGRSRFEKATETYLQALNANMRGNERQAVQSELKPTLDAVGAALARLHDAMLDNNAAVARTIMTTDLGATTRNATGKMAEIQSADRERTQRVIAATQARGDSFFMLNAVLGFAGLALALLFGYYIGRSITAPVQKLTETVRAVAAGNIDARAKVGGYDEIGVLGDALDKLLDEKVTTLARAEHENAQLNDSVINLLRAVARLSKRDLTVKVPVTEDVTGPVADAINQLASETARVLSDVSRVADQVAAASAQVKSKAENVNAVATDQQSEAVDTAHKLNHASERLSQIAKLAEQCNELARSAAQNTESAVATVTGTLRGMTDIREVIQETGKRIKRLGERSQEISGIVDIINKIAERTTVLALNASMQAAAAGDAGRGFGVVADEVQRLAESTRNAAGQIGTLIKSMQIETNDTIGTMENAIGQVVEGSKMAEVAGQQIGETQGATTALVRSVREIAASSQEQAELSVTLRDRAHAMITGVRETGEQINQQLQETVNLTDFARLLLDSVRVFKLPAPTQQP